MEEVIDEDSLKSPLPSLSWWHESIYLPEAEFRENTPICPRTGDFNFHTPTFDVEEEEEYRATISFGLFSSPRDSFVEYRAHPEAKRMPGLFNLDRVSMHSSTSQVSSMGDDDPHGLCDEALEEAIHILSMRSARMLERANEPPPTGDNDSPA
jgi:hypothetical protein